MLEDLFERFNYSLKGRVLEQSGVSAVARAFVKELSAGVGAAASVNGYRSPVGHFAFDTHFDSHFLIVNGALK